MPEEDFGLDEQGVLETLLESNYGLEQARQTMSYLPSQFYKWGTDNQAEWLSRNGVIDAWQAIEWDEEAQKEVTVLYRDVGRVGQLVLRQMGERAEALLRLPQIEKEERQWDVDWTNLQRQREEISQRRKETERQGQVAERFNELSERMPTTGQVEASFLEGATSVSPRFRQMAEGQLLPDIYKELGMAQRRQETFQTGLNRIAGQLLPETEQEKELMALRRADPWAQLLSQPSFLEQLQTRFRSLTPSERGFTSGRFRPMTRFIS